MALNNRHEEPVIRLLLLLCLVLGVVRTGCENSISHQSTVHNNGALNLGDCIRVNYLK